MKLLKILTENESRFEIKPKEDARCPDGRCQMYNVYLDGKEIYEFANTSFRELGVEQLAERLFNTFDKGDYKLSYADSVIMAVKISKYLSK